MLLKLQQKQSTNDDSSEKCNDNTTPTKIQELQTKIATLKNEINDKQLSIDDFKVELLKTDSIIRSYDNFIPLFRFPYLKEGNTEEKIFGIRNVLKKHGYKNGYVTIDASDWYINRRLLRKQKKEGETETSRQFPL